VASDFSLHPEAFEDLEEIRAYLAANSTNAADRVISEVYRTIREVLVPFPHAGHRRTELTSRPLRFVVVLNQYLIAYAPAQRPLWIVAVIHTRRSPRVMAAILRGRE